MVKVQFAHSFKEHQEREGKSAVCSRGWVGRHGNLVQAVERVPQLLQLDLLCLLYARNLL